MPLLDPNSVGGLFARKKRARAIEALKAQIRDGLGPGVHARLQLADLLVLAGRGEEAAPILLGLADEFASDGFIAKAIAILKRVEKIQPRRPEVKAKLAELVSEQLRLAPTVSAPVRLASDIGMEEIQEAEEDAGAGRVEPEPPPPADGAARDTAAMEVSGDEPLVVPAEEIAGEGRSWAEAVEAPRAEAQAPCDLVLGQVPPTGAPAGDTPAGQEDRWAAPAEPPASTPPTRSEQGEAGSPLPPADLAPRSTDEPSLAAETAAGQREEVLDGSEPERLETEGEPGAESVGSRIRGAFRRFLASLPGASGEPSRANGSTAGEAGPTVTAEELAPGIVEEASLAAAEPTDPAAEAAGPIGNGAAAESDAVSDEVLHGQILDLVEDVLHRPPASDRVEPLDSSPVAGSDAGSRLVASRLLGGLSQEELLAVVQGLELQTFEAGDIIVTEGEPGHSLFILTTGSAKVFVRGLAGHDIEVATLCEGDFFGEISCVSGQPRTATVTAATPCEMLELQKVTLDVIATKHPRIRERIEDSYIKRASNPAVAAIRAVELADPDAQRRASQALQSHFGDSRWDPRMRLRLADVLLKAGKDQDAVPILVGLADDMAREGFPEKAIAILKKIERIQSRYVREVNLAPLRRARPSAEAALSQPPEPEPSLSPAPTQRGGPGEAFQHWLVDLVREAVRKGGPGSQPAPELRSGDVDPATLRIYGPGLAASPLFEGFSEDELLAVIRGLRLLSFRPGDVILTEGEAGASVYILVEGTVKVALRDRRGHNAPLCSLQEGAFFGEIATLTGRPRTATVTAATPCELLELDKPALETIVAGHPRVGEVLEAFYRQRVESPEAARLRGPAAGPPPAVPAP